MIRTLRCAVVLSIGFLTLSVMAGAQSAQTQQSPRDTQSALTPAAEQGPENVIPVDQQPTSQQLDRLFDVMRVKEQMAATAKTLPLLMQQQFARQIEERKKDHPELARLSSEQQQASAKLVAKFMTEVMSLYSTDEMMADMKTVYQRHLSSSDVENLITFYSSPSGQHMLDMVPAIMKEFMPLVMQKMESKIRPLADEMSKEMLEINQSPTGKSDQDKTAQPK